MIHIVFNAADTLVLQKAIELDETLQGDIHQIKDDFAVGPLQDIYTEQGRSHRLQWWKTVSSEVDETSWTNTEDPEVDAQLVNRLQEKLNHPEEQVWIWAAQNQHDVCGYYWLTSQLKNYQQQVYVLYLNNLPFINEKGQLFYPTWLHAIPPKEFLKAKKLARPITPSEFEVDADEWVTLCQESVGVRLLEGGKKLVEQPHDFYDEALKKFITTEWQKASKIVTQYLQKATPVTGDTYLLWRLKLMIHKGVLEGQSSLKKVKDFEVKIKSNNGQELTA
jgi:hypothetical protein